MTTSGTFFADVISGQTNIWSAFGGDMVNFLISLMIHLSD